MSFLKISLPPHIFVCVRLFIFCCVIYVIMFVRVLYSLRVCVVNLTPPLSSPSRRDSFTTERTFSRLLALPILNKCLVTFTDEIR